MTQKEWTREVERALAAAGLPWRVAAAWVEQVGSALCAELVDIRSGKERSIRLPALVFRTDKERREEIVRQLQRR